MKTKFINKILLFSCLGLFATLANAQTAIIQLRDAQGVPVRAKSYGDIKGSPYLTTEWSKGTVKQENGQTYADVNVRYDLLEDQLLFKNGAGAELAFVIPVVEFKLTYDEKGTQVTKIYRNGFAPFEGSTDKTYYELLYDGTVKLVKKNLKKIESTQEYNSPPTQNIVDRIKYFYVVNNGLVEFKRDTKSLVSAFGSKSTGLQQYMKDNKLNLKNDEDLIKIFTYFSTL